MKRPALWDIHTASANDAQRRRIQQRAKLLPRKNAVGPKYRVCVVVGGRGSLRRLADILASLVADTVIEAGAPIETADAITTLSLGGPDPLVAILAPAKIARPLLDELEARRRHRAGVGAVDVLVGLKSRDREAFLRHAIRMARGET